MRSVLLLLLAASCVVPLDCAQAQEGEPITIGKRFSLHSETLDEERPYWVYLPASYEDDTYALQRYPVLYLLDGDAHFASAAGVVHFMSAGINANVQIPELIIVAIPNTDRTRDLTPTHSTVFIDGSRSAFLQSSGGGNRFLDFLERELIAKIDSSYRTQPYRILVGHSFGGLLTLHALLESPEVFQAHIAMDPSLWWDDRLLVRRVAGEVGERPKPRGSVYLSLANNPDVGRGDPAIMMNAGRDFVAALQEAPSSGLRSQLRYFEHEDHGSVPLLSLYHGLLFTFEGYKPSTELLIESPAAINEHFERISAQLGISLLPSGRFINGLGYAMLYQLGDVDKAIDLFMINARNFPSSSRAHASLGEAYALKGETALAVESFEEALRLDPDNRNVRERLQQATAQ